MQSLARIDLPHIQRFTDRHGHVRHYLRRPGCKRVTLPGEPGSPEFMAAYSGAGPPKKGAGTPAKAGTVAALLVAFYASAEFKILAEDTRRNYRFIYERFRERAGSRPVAAMTRLHVQAMLDHMSDTPGAARNFRKRLSKLMDFAVTRGWRETNPCRDVKPPKSPGKGFRPWEDADIAKFERAYPAGSRERRALYLLLYTGQRRSDIPGMGRQHVKAGKIAVSQFKGRNAAWGPVRLSIPMHPRLIAELALAPADLTFITTAHGKPFSHAGFTSWFVDAAKAAGLHGLSPHGLRKAAARRLAEAGCSAKQIASITGHRTLKEVEHYTESADQVRLAEGAIAALGGRS